MTPNWTLDCFLLMASHRDLSQLFDIGSTGDRHRMLVTYQNGEGRADIFNDRFEQTINSDDERILKKKTNNEKCFWIFTLSKPSYGWILVT